ncbi:MAG: hypothetical protein GX447_02070 [Elusimicrobia bacterium]|nr:hypothetical protein [Elusimicrobiota bacterium]
MKNIFSIVILFCAGVSAQAPSSVKTIFLKGGISAPVFGHWGDSDSGFKPALNGSFLFVKDIDEGLSWGLETGYDIKHKNRNNDIKVSVFNFSPVLFSWLGINERKYYVYLGPGIYHWTSPKSSAFSSSSSTEFGLKAGGGILKNYSKGLSMGLEFRFEHLFDMKGENFDLGSANNAVLSFVLGKRI